MKTSVRQFFYCCAILIISGLAAHAAATPPSALKWMPARAISLRWQKLPTDQKNAVWLHIYCVPKGRAPELKELNATGPITRNNITPGPSLLPSPFCLDIFADSAANKRLNSVKFEETQDVGNIVLRWLEPAKRRGPVLLLNFGFMHWHEWQTFTFVRGWNDAAHRQTFFYGGEGDIYNFLRFDQTDAQGRLIVTEEEGRATGKERINIYRWNGREWDDKSLKYFVVGASVKTKSAADAVLKERGYGEITRSDDYGKLRPGYWIWVAGRFRTSAEAQEIAREIVKNGDVATVRMAR